MDKKTKNNLVVGGAFAVVAGYFGYRYFKKKSDAKKAAAAEAAAKAAAKTSASGTTGGQTTGGGTGYAGPTPYQKKVMTLQTRLGISVDGDPGFTSLSQTNLTVASWFPVTYAKLGNVSPSNIDSYLALGTKKETGINRASEILTALNAGKTAIIRLGGDAGAMYFDTSSNSYKATGGVLTILPGTQFTKADLLAPLSSSFWVVKLPYKFGTYKRFVAINPSTWDIYTV